MSQEVTEKIPPAYGSPEGETGSFRLIATLGIAGFFSGILLVGVFLSTRPIIQAHRAQALQEAIYHVLPGCTRYQTLELQNGELVLIEEEEEQEGSKGEAPRRVYAGYDDSGKLTGIAIQGEEPGFQDVIVAIFGYDPAEKMIIGFEVLESKETPGLGDKIMKDVDFLANFRALSVEPDIEVVKKGTAQQANQVEAITGATISSKAVVRLLEKELAAWRPVLEDYLREEQ
jgi:electron transport complex protein RnfG